MKYFNDSYSTNTGTCLAAVDSFDTSTVVIVGGFDKGLDYESFANELVKRDNVSAALLIGNTAKKIEDFLKALSPSFIVENVETLENAVKRGSEIAMEKAPAVVLMSPAASSFDQFKSYKERGERFREFANKIAN